MLRRPAKKSADRLYLTSANRAPISGAAVQLLLLSCVYLGLVCFGLGFDFFLFSLDLGLGRFLADLDLFLGVPGGSAHGLFLLFERLLLGFLVSLDFGFLLIAADQSGGSE